MKTDWIIAISSVVTALTIFIICLQIKWDHERSRRQIAIELITDWAKSVTVAMSSARRFVEDLNSSQVKLFISQKELTVKKEESTLVMSCIKDRKDLGIEEINSSEIKLSPEIIAEIRWYAVAYLDALECVLSAWRHGVASGEIIIEQFKFLLEKSFGNTLMKEFRESEHGSVKWPSITAFEAFIQSPNRKIKKGLKRIACFTKKEKID